MDRAWFIVSAAAVVLIGAVLAARRQEESNWDGLVPDGWQDIAPVWGDGEPDQNTTVIEDLIVNMNPSTYAPAFVSPDQAAANLRAFLDMIAFAEGTARLGENGYNVLFGGSTFDSYADHPRVRVPFRDTYSTAAGRYQILARTWDGLRDRLGLSDFSPASQDAAAVELIRERGALNDAKAGRVAQAVGKVAKVWASLPGAGYDQPERQLSSLLRVYASAGGTMENQA